MKDLESVAAHGCNPKISKFMSNEFPDSVEKWKAFLEFAVTNEKILYLAIEIDGQAVGGIGISLQNDKTAELGYWLGEDFWGNGIMTEAIGEIVRLGFERFEIDKIYAKPFENNYASHKVLEKAGFILETKNEKAILKNGEFRDELIYTVKRDIRKKCTR